MKEQHIYLKDLINDLNSWASELDLQKEQISIYENRLAEVLQANSKQEVRARGEQFQNKLIRQREVIDILHHDMKLEKQRHAEFAKDHPIAIDHVYFKDHKELRDRIFTNSDIFRSFRNEFYAYIEKWI